MTDKVWVLTEHENTSDSCVIRKVFTTKEAALSYLKDYKPMWYDRDGSITAWHHPKYRWAYFELDWYYLEGAND